MASKIVAAKKAPPFTLISSIIREDYPHDFQQHRCVLMASVMAEFHNILIRSFNSAYQNAEGIKPGTQDAEDLLLYSRFLCEVMIMHHDWEETSYFPALETFAGQPGILGSNVQQHHAFEKGLGRFLEYCKQPKEQFSAQKFQALIDEFAPALEKHFHEEPPSFYRLRHLDSDGLSKIYLEQEKIALSKSNPWS